jgi:hypothetical protein
MVLSGSFSMAGEVTRTISSVNPGTIDEIGYVLPPSDESKLMFFQVKVVPTHYVQQYRQ